MPRGARTSKRLPDEGRGVGEHCAAWTPTAHAPAPSAAVLGAIATPSVYQADDAPGRGLPNVPATPSAPEAVAASGSTAAGGDGTVTRRPRPQGLLLSDADPSLVHSGLSPHGASPARPLDRADDPASSPD